MLGFSIESDAIFHCFFRCKNLKVGDLIKVKHPTLGLIIKHIVFIDRNGLFWLRRDTPMSQTTLEMGPIRAKQIIGKALLLSRQPTEKHNFSL